LRGVKLRVENSYSAYKAYYHQRMIGLM